MILCLWSNTGIKYFMHHCRVVLYLFSQFYSEDDRETSPDRLIEKSSLLNINLIHLLKTHGLGTQLHLVNFVNFGSAMFVFNRINCPSSWKFWDLDSVVVLALGCCELQQICNTAKTQFMRNERNRTQMHHVLVALHGMRIIYFPVKPSSLYGQVVLFPLLLNVN